MRFGINSHDQHLNQIPLLKQSAGMGETLKADFGDVNQAIYAWRHFHEGSEVCDSRNFSANDLSFLKSEPLLPGVRFEGFDGERNFRPSFLARLNLQNPHLHLLASLKNLGWMIVSPMRDLRDVDHP